jgi:DNA-binding PadR family transcriptional regulator
VSPVFSHGRLRLYLLPLLAEGPRHGYELMRLLEERFQGLYMPSAGTIYPRLARLEAEGLVTHVEVGGRKTYSITEAGRAELAARADEVAELPREIASAFDDLTGLADDIARQVRGRVRDNRRRLREQARAVRQDAIPATSRPGTDVDLYRRLDDFVGEVRTLIERASPSPAQARAVAAVLDSSLKSLRDLLR